MEELFFRIKVLILLPVSKSLTYCILILTKKGIFIERSYYLLPATRVIVSTGTLWPSCPQAEGDH
jgi:hypothetical protein